jgi:hypothetical protein
VSHLTWNPLRHDTAVVASELTVNELVTTQNSRRILRVVGGLRVSGSTNISTAVISVNTGFASF